MVLLIPVHLGDVNSAIDAMVGRARRDGQGSRSELLDAFRRVGELDHRRHRAVGSLAGCVVWTER